MFVSMIAMVMTFVVMIVMVLVIMLFMVVIIMILVIMLFMIMIVIVLFMVMVVMILVIMVVMILMVMVVMILVIMHMHFSVKVLRFSPNKSGPNGCLNGKRAAILKPPLENTTEHAVDGVVLGFSLKVGIKSTVTFNGHNGSEVKLAGLKCCTAATMGTMGINCRASCQRQSK